jgi:hypothetical protein
MPRRAGDDKVEGPAAWVPALELGNFHLDLVPAGHLGHQGVGFNADNSTTRADEETTRLRGPAANVEHVVRSGGEQVIDQSLGVRGASTLVKLSHGSEPLCRRWQSVCAHFVHGFVSKAKSL